MSKNHRLIADTDRVRNLKIYSLLERLTRTRKITWSKVESPEHDLFTAKVGPFSAHLLVHKYPQGYMRMKIITGDLANDGDLYTFNTQHTVMEEMRIYGCYENLFDLYLAICASSTDTGRTSRDDLTEYLETL